VTCEGDRDGWKVVFNACLASVDLERRSDQFVTDRELEDMNANWTKVILLVSLVTIGMAAAAGNRASGAEVATVRNESNGFVTFHAKWSNVPYESSPITLAPGQSYKLVGPDAAQLGVRFNATPNSPWISPRVYRVRTWRVYTPYSPGYVSRFRWATPYLIDLYF
jgi:hypothetical protein